LKIRFSPIYAQRVSLLRLVIDRWAVQCKETEILSIYHTNQLRILLCYQFVKESKFSRAAAPISARGGLDAIALAQGTGQRLSCSKISSISLSIRVFLIHRICIDT
jgi:hypothetical protein